MNTFEVSKICKCSLQNIQKKTKQAINDKSNYIKVKENIFIFEIITNKYGKAYDFIQFTGKIDEILSVDALGSNANLPHFTPNPSANLLTPTGANFGETSTNLSPFSSKFLSSHPTNVQIAHPTNTQTQDIKARIAYANTKKGAIALEKERILKAYERAKKSGVKSLNFIKNINANPTFFLKLSANKLFAWQRAYKESGFAGLIDERKSNR